MKRLLLFILCIYSLNVSAQTWTQQASLPANADGRNHGVAFSIGNFGYLTTGGSSQFYYNDFYRYDPSNDTWTALNPFPGGARSFSIGVENNGKGYLGFGLTPQGGYLADLWSYDPVTNQWTQLANFPGQARIHPAMLATEDKIFVGCGGASTGNLRDWWEYDIPTNSWSQKPNFPGVDRHHPYQFSIDNQAYVGFGHGNGIFRDMYRYDPTTEVWTVMASLPAQGRVAGTQFAFNGKGYLLSGQGEDHLNLPTGEFWEYDPTTNQWTSLPAHPSNGRWAPASFVIGNTVYFTCGESSASPDINEKDLWKYELSFPAAINDLSQTNIKVYPNPATDVLLINDVDNEVKQIVLLDYLGRPLLKTTSKSLDIASFAKGTYFVQIHLQDQVVGTTFTKK